MEKVGCIRQFESELSLRSFAQPFPSGYRGCINRPFNSLYDPFGSPCRGQKRSSNRYAIRLADHQRSTPAAELQFFVRDEPALLTAFIPRAMPWAKSFCPFRACCVLQTVWVDKIPFYLHLYQRFESFLTHALQQGGFIPA